MPALLIPKGTPPELPSSLPPEFEIFQRELENFPFSVYFQLLKRLWPLESTFFLFLPDFPKEIYDFDEFL